ncbi:glycosyl transferase [Sphingomonas sanxanigenens]|uniref:Glycosyl transferase family 28 C-terminal domain-containing protein n=1 Tax=Sphingomonas sanxanigenens DSM 19645 = NX02 TaxID=1123269 RepID=W0AFR4_9SPHN|nr:glycosyl transferase [Sphingomonas sanxanigenens]AHE55951.1 hypothetical protein NX02_21600 [Sphingomonas sanxanigenens DSM 19645 = NX02]
MIGYYVHHHGDGHRQRALAIAQAAGGGITLLGTGLTGRTGRIPCVDLPDDRLTAGSFDGADHVGRPGSLHYAPLDHEGIRWRVAKIADWIASARPRLFVVDVSVEVAMLARLASVPTVYVRLSGHRTDRPHLDAYQGASALLAPFHPDLDDEAVDAVIRGKSFYASGIGAAAAPEHVQTDLVVGVVGRGGQPSDGALWAEAARAVPNRRWRVIGPCTAPRDTPPNLELRGWVNDADRHIASAGVVVGAGGDGLVASVIANRRPFICIPERRPFDEQHCKARRLSHLGAAIVSPDWPASPQWPAMIERVEALDPAALAGLHDRDGAAKAAQWLVAMAATPIRQPSA